MRTCVLYHETVIFLSMCVLRPSNSTQNWENVNPPLQNPAYATKENPMLPVAVWRKNWDGEKYLFLFHKMPCNTQQIEKQNDNE